MVDDSVTFLFTRVRARRRRPRLRARPALTLLGWVLALSVFAGSAAAQAFFDSPLAPPDTSSPRATLQSFLDNVREAHDVLMPAYASYLAAPGLFPPETAREEEARAKELLKRAVRTLDLSEIPPADQFVEDQEACPVRSGDSE